MSLTRKMLRAMGIEDEKIDQIIEAHAETVDALKEEKNNYKADAEKLSDVQKKLDDMIKAAETNDNDHWETEYNALKQEFDAYKTDQQNKEIYATKKTAFKQLLKNIGISEKRVDAVVKVSDLDSIELESDGKIKDADKVSEKLKSEWSDFIIQQEQRGADIIDPPENTNGSAFEAMTLVDKMTYANANPDAAEVINWLKK